jgi:hypothetical protein
LSFAASPNMYWTRSQARTGSTAVSWREPIGRDGHSSLHPLLVHPRHHFPKQSDE